MKTILSDPGRSIHGTGPKIQQRSKDHPTCDLEANLSLFGRDLGGTRSAVPQKAAWNNIAAIFYILHGIN